MDFYISAATDTGITKRVNQDSLFVRKLKTRTGNMVFAVLCDGMGGLSQGEVASASLAQAFSDWMWDYLPLLSQGPLEDGVIREQWIHALDVQNQKIQSYGIKNGCKTGSTVTALLLTEERYYLCNIGDSRAYEIGEATVQLTVDHTVIAREVELGNLTREQAKNAPMQNVLTRCVGVKNQVYPDLFFGEVRAQTVYMLCSDGFRHQITEEEMQKYLWRLGRGDVSRMKEQEEYLIGLNRQRGETDNISVITIFTQKPLDSRVFGSGRYIDF